MGTSQSVLVVVTHPKHPLTEDAYNEWYSNNHLSYVLFSQRFPSASRFRQARVVKGMMAPYLALYQADWPRAWDAQSAYADVMKRGVGAKWNRPPGDSLQVEWWSYYEKLAESGTPSPDPDPPPAILVTFAHPDGGMGNTSIFLAEAVESWYRRFLEDLQECPFVRGSTFYRLGLRAGGPQPPLYMSVHELRAGQADSADAFHSGILRWMRGAKLRADPAEMTKANSPIALDFWGYYEHIATRTAALEDELLRRRGDPA